MKTYQMQAMLRDAAGQKAKSLLARQTVPATIYGKGLESVSVSIKLDDFRRVYAEAGETGLVYAQVGQTAYPVLVQSVQVHPVTGTVLHVELHKVDLKEKVKANVPVSVVDESPAVAEKKGVLLTLVSEVEVEALPGELPEKLPVSASGLAEVDQELIVAQLSPPEGVVVLTSPETVLVRVAPLVSKEAQEDQARKEAAAVESEPQAASEESGQPEQPSQTGETSE